MTVKEIQEIVQVGRHNHKATEADSDKCAYCGHDLKHPIHHRTNREDNETVADSFFQLAKQAVEEVKRRRDSLEVHEMIHEISNSTADFILSRIKKLTEES